MPRLEGTRVYCEAVHDDWEGFRIWLRPEDSNLGVTVVRFGARLFYANSDEGDRISSVLNQYAIVVGLIPVLAPLKQARRQPKPLTDPVTASVGGLLSLVLAAGGLYLGFHALATGCVSLMRGRHGPAVVHCSPEGSYWVATTVSLVLGAALLVVAWKFLQLARSTRGANAPGR